MILKLGMYTASGTQALQYDDPGLTLTYFTVRSNLVDYKFEWGELLQSHSMGEKLAAKD